jgi:preprotein translocase subunit YajC
MFVVFYFVLIAPMRKQQKKTKELLSSLKKGDRVVTTGGIYGTLAQVEDQVVWLKIADTIKIKLNRSAIAGLATDQDTSKETST